VKNGRPFSIIRHCNLDADERWFSETFLLAGVALQHLKMVACRL